jgi:hypothetical protein
MYDATNIKESKNERIKECARRGSGIPELCCNHLRDGAFTLLLIVVVVFSAISLGYSSTQIGVAVSMTGTGRITAANSPPKIIALSIGNRNSTAVNVDTMYLWRVMVGDNNSIADLVNVTIYLHMSDVKPGLFDEQRSYAFRWLKGDLWQELDSVGWTYVGTYLNHTESDHTPISTKVGGGEWDFAITLPKLALFSESSHGWLFEADAHDNAGASDVRLMSFGVNLYVSQLSNGALIANAVSVTRPWGTEWV